ncbi:hypothetical protein ACLB2K_004931 [Fragaria x ananassa]
MRFDFQKLQNFDSFSRRRLRPANQAVAFSAGFWWQQRVRARIVFTVEQTMAMYIRVKRSKTTYFIQCEPTETILDIKQKLQNLVDQPVNDQRLILVSTGEVLDDSKTLADQKVENDGVVALTLRKDDDEFEEVNIVRPDDLYQSRDADAGSW